MCTIQFACSADETYRFYSPCFAVKFYHDNLRFVHVVHGSNNSYFAEEASSTGTNNIDNVSGPERGKRKVLQLEGVAVDSAETASVGRLRSRYGNRDDEIEVSVSQKKSRR